MIAKFFLGHHFYFNKFPFRRSFSCCFLNRAKKSLWQWFCWFTSVGEAMYTIGISSTSHTKYKIGILPIFIFSVLLVNNLWCAAVYFILLFLFCDLIIILCRWFSNINPLCIWVYKLAYGFQELLYILLYICLFLNMFHLERNIFSYIYQIIC